MQCPPISAAQFLPAFSPYEKLICLAIKPALSTPYYKKSRCLSIELLYSYSMAYLFQTPKLYLIAATQKEHPMDKL